MSRLSATIPWSLVLAAALCAGGARASEIPSRTSLEGTWKVLPGNLAPANAYLAGIDDSAWGTLEVPGNWHLQGQDFTGVVWYRRHFQIGDVPAGRLVKLQFDAVDYTADVWVNGHYAGYHEGYFEPFSFYIQPYLEPGDNLLVVRVNSPNETPEAWSLHKRLIKGVLSHHDTRPGGAWSARGQEQNTGGIWGAVSLSAPTTVDIRSVQVTTRAESGDSWLVAMDVELSQSGRDGPLRLEAQVEPESFTSTGPPHPPAILAFTPAGGPQTVHIETRIRSPRLWWTWDQGRPNLYRLILRASDGNQVLAESAVRFGFRSIQVDRATRQWRLNGRPVFLRGTNYISSQWLSEMTPARLGFDLELMKHANINAIRVHAHLESEAFYSQCDEKGVLVWQDFPLQWGYDEDPAFVREASRQATGMVAWLYNHPSVGAWTLQNEPPFDADWMKYKYRDYQPEQNRLLNDTLTRVVTEADPTRWVHAYSTTGEHQWLGWYSGSWLDFAKPSHEAIISEYGAQALPGLPSLRRMFSEAELWPATDAQWEKWEFHNFQRHETFDLAGVQRGANIDEFIANTQRYQARLIQFAAENYRRQKYAPVTGIFEFLFNEDWPSINWGVVDYWRAPKPGYDALRVAYQPVLPSIAWSKDRWAASETPSMALWIVNDLAQSFSGAGLASTLRISGQILAESVQRVDILPDSSARISTLSFPGLTPGRYSLLVTLRQAGGEPLGENAFEFTVDSPAALPPAGPKK